MAIKDNTTGGKIISATTNNVLTIKGALYGNIERLVDNRTHIERTANNTLKVGTIVSFGSQMFQKPAPLLSTFVKDYFDSKKVSQ